ncbi:hypothetical protein K4K56_009633 [Colletotrichum sp. SAR 10_98]|nr:hypothetical protein K4K55_002635 [Colletotrichum sp. SAR 10_96]KAI8285290.1 hypothetical protein K4K56_009633 [Colletotrichum sp. SAR 10_98]
MVRFDDLWHLFKIGDLLYQPLETGFPPAADGRQATTKRYQTAFVLHRKDNYSTKNNKTEESKFHRRPMHLDCFYLDFDGESYGPVGHTIIIDFFLGQQDIRKLKGYPMRYAANSEKIVESLAIQGKTFRSFVQEKHVSCDGWTLTGPPMGSSWAPEDVQLPAHVDSDVIIDFKEALERQPLWRSEFEAPAPVDISEDWVDEEDEVRLLHWPDSSTETAKPGPLFRLTEMIQIDDGVADHIQSVWVKSDPFLKAFGSQGTKTLEGINEDMSNLLLPQRAFVYVLRARSFAMVDVRSLKHVQDQNDIFDDLKIDEEHKVIVQSLVADHFEKRNIQRRNPMSGPISQDLVGGKGAGLCILLHVDRTLTDLFRLAHLWDCVLLLDEADIFLGKRDNQDLTRNALVSVFLRILEYYSGILFLTTNRVGTLDEAFKSRIHISLYYEPLNKLQTIEIFRLNLKKLSAIEEQKHELQNNTGQRTSKLIIDEDRIMEYAIHHFENHHKTPHLRWNGRQIRNAFQIASSLAHYHIRKTSLSEEPSVASSERNAVVLDHRQFQRVAVAIERFGRFVTEGGEEIL